MLGPEHVCIAVETVQEIADHHGIIEMVAQVPVRINLFQSGASEFKQCTPAAVTGRNKDLVTNNDRSG